MRALLYDIHGNLPALEAVVKDAREAGATEFVLGGDYAMTGAWPQETVKLLGKLDDAGWIRGNTERWLEEPFDAPDSQLVHRLIEYCRDQLGHKRIDKLYRLPQTLELDGALVCHASPRDDMLTFMPEATGGDDALLADDDPEIVFFGHSHIQFSRETGTGRFLVNPGSVGLPFDGDRRAAYALWAGGREVELRRVAYDSDAYAAQVRQRMGETLGPEVETLVRGVEQATMLR
jgi:diadenosine tetraphosphatase ApaH/serine/threonine PP2A family protein phosphatase